MLVTKHAFELCTLVVSDLLGELPSRVLAALFTQGRSTITKLGHSTRLGPKYLRNGLGVLIQHNLLYHYTDDDTKVTSYEANIDACYNLLRSGKILQAVGDQHGTAGRDLIQTLLLLGHARVADLSHAFTTRASDNHKHANGDHAPNSGSIESENQLHAVLTRLIQEELVEPVRPDSFRNPAEVYREIESEVTKTALGEKVSRNKIDQHMQVVERYREFRDQSRALKRQLDESNGPVAKRRKLQNGASHHEDPFADDTTPLNPNLVVRVNHEKCLVLLRNQRLADFATNTLGEVTGQVYKALLALLTSQVPRCRSDQQHGDRDGQKITVTSIQIYEHLDEGVDVQSGIGKAPREKIDSRSAEKIRPSPLDFDDSDSDDPNSKTPMPRDRTSRIFTAGDAEGSSEDEVLGRPISSRQVNGSGHAKVKFEDKATFKNSRLDQMRQHLLLLAESKHRFVRHCSGNGRGEWTVDFDQLIESLREAEVDAFIEQSFGRQGLRLTRILREKGKLDEKMLPLTALMKKSDVQGKMVAMQMAGLVRAQEVPKDNSRMANRTLLFWQFDGEQTQAQLLNDVYKAMLRCMQTLQVERHRERDLLSFVERADVKGQEENVMTPEHYNKYNRLLEQHARLMGQIMRLDDMLAVIRDY